MPDFKCAACRIRLRSPAGDTARRPCPVCEAPLEPVMDLSELVGFRSLQPPGAEVEALRAAAERWLDEGGGVNMKAVAAALDPPPPNWIEK